MLVRLGLFLVMLFSYSAGAANSKTTSLNEQTLTEYIALLENLELPNDKAITERIDFLRGDADANDKNLVLGELIVMLDAEPYINYENKLNKDFAHYLADNKNKTPSPDYVYSILGFSLLISYFQTILNYVNLGYPDEYLPGLAMNSLGIAAYCFSKKDSHKFLGALLMAFGSAYSLLEIYTIYQSSYNNCAG